MHADAIIAIAASKDSKALTAEVFGDEIGWLPWKRPGYELGLWLETFCRENPEAKGCVLESHGLFTWGDDAKDCYETTLEVINRAIAWLETRTAGVPAFGGGRCRRRCPPRSGAVAARLMPAIRGMVSTDVRMVGHFDDQPAVLEFVGAKDMARAGGARDELPGPFPPHQDPAAGRATSTRRRPTSRRRSPACGEAVAAYRADYAGYYERCRRPDSPALRDPNAVVYLVPGVGMITFAKDKATARISGEFYVNAINVMRGASAISEYRGLPEQEAFDIEYWLLEEAKLQRMPKPKSLAGRIALVTGGAGGIGSATAERLPARRGVRGAGRHRRRRAGGDGGRRSPRGTGADVVRTVRDGRDLGGGGRGGLSRRRRWGSAGCDIVVSNAGIASSAPIEETTLALWNRNMDILSTGLLPRLARGVPADEGAGHRRGDGLRRLEERARRLAERRGLLHGEGGGDPSRALPGAGGGAGGHPGERRQPRRGAARLEDLGGRVAGAARRRPTGPTRRGSRSMYRQRSLLRRSVLPEDIAEAAYFLASDASAKSTGNILNVDAGNVQAFTR